MPENVARIIFCLGHAVSVRAHCRFFDNLLEHKMEKVIATSTSFLICHGLCQSFANLMISPIVLEQTMNGHEHTKKSRNEWSHQQLHYLMGFALCRWPLSSHCDCPKLSFGRPAASILGSYGAIFGTQGTPWRTMAAAGRTRRGSIGFLYILQAGFACRGSHGVFLEGP